MRKSVCEDDSGFDNRRYKVFVDDKEVTNRCHTADEEEGVAYCYALNAEGNKYVDHKTGDVARETLHGKVRIGKELR